MDGNGGTDGQVRVAVENVGGIDETAVDFGPGVTLLTGRNATNRTSFLRAVMAGLGSDDAALKADADEGSVELAVGDEQFTRTLRRSDGTVVDGGDPYLDGNDVELAELFAFLLESNDARQAAVRGGDLREVVMRPLDTDRLAADIERLQDERRRLEAELDALDSTADRHDRLRTERAAAEAELEARREELPAVEEELEDVQVEESREAKAALESELDALRERRNELERVRHELETERESVEALRDERGELDEELEALPAVDDGELARLDDELQRLRERKQALDATVGTLQQVIRFNEETLAGRGGVFSGFDDGTASDGGLTDQLVADDEHVTCWTCGTAVETGQIDRTVDRLRELSTAQVEERTEIAATIDDLEAEREALEAERRRRDEVEDRLERLDDELDDGEARIGSLEARRDELSSAVDDLEAAVDAFETEDFGEALDLHREATRLEIEVDRLEAEVERLDEQLADLEARLEERADLEERLESVGEELEDRRTAIERLETRAVETFNEQMETVLDLLEYGNIDRLWIERVEGDSGADSAFDAHVVRRTDDGTYYEDELAHLSESEREVTGLVFALAGFLAHDVHETVPFMLLDSLEALDSARIAALVEYLEDYVDYLLVALLPEDAGALDDRHERVESI